MLTAPSYGADGATFRLIFLRQGLFWFLQSLTAGYKLPGIVRQQATSLSAVQHVQGFAFVVFRILSVTCSLTRGLSQSLTHAQQLFSASTPGQILAPRVCTLVLFIVTVSVSCMPIYVLMTQGWFRRTTLLTKYLTCMRHN